MDRTLGGRGFVNTVSMLSVLRKIKGECALGKKAVPLAQLLTMA